MLIVRVLLLDQQWRNGTRVSAVGTNAGSSVQFRASLYSSPRYHSPESGVATLGRPVCIRTKPPSTSQ